MRKNTNASTSLPILEPLLFKRFIALFNLIVFLIIGFMYSSANAETDTASFYHHFEKLSFKNQHSQEFRVSQLRNKVVLFNFIYTQCSTVCSLQTKSLVEVMNTLPKAIKPNVAFVSVSLDPFNDTPEKLTAFAKQNRADISNWSFITGKSNDVVTLSDRLNLFGIEKNKRDAAVRPNDHSTHLWLIDTKGRVIMRYMGNPVDTARIATEIAQLTSI